MLPGGLLGGKKIVLFRGQITKIVFGEKWPEIFMFTVARIQFWEGQMKVLLDIINIWSLD